MPPGDHGDNPAGDRHERRLSRRVKTWVVLGWTSAGLASLLVACGSDSRPGLGPEDRATIGANQEQVAEIQTQVAALITAVPSARPATPVASFEQSWDVVVEGVTLTPSFLAATAEAGGDTVVEAHGTFLAVHLEVTNLGLVPFDRFPWWDLRLYDERGRMYTPQREATANFVASQSTIRKPDDYQPGIVYDEAVVFDVPPEARGFVLASTDGTVGGPLPPATDGGGTPLPPVTNGGGTPRS